MARRLYLGKEAIEETSGVGIILVSPDEKIALLMPSLEFYAFRPIEGNHTPATVQERKYKEEVMDATTLFYRFRITHLPKILNSKTEVLTRLATIRLKFLNQEVSMGIKIRPSVEVERAAPKVPVKKSNYD
ncbi:hypothetical protein Tco_0906016 [Tanacetum coccineum]